MAACVAVTSMTTITAQQIFKVAQEMPVLAECKKEEDRAAQRKCQREMVEQHLTANMKYPKEALDAQKSGTAVISFIVRASGDVADLRIVEDPGYGMGKEALRLIKKLNKNWAPGMTKGEPVSVEMSLPVIFRLPDEETEEPKMDPNAVHTYVEQMPRYAGCNAGTPSEVQKCNFEKIMAFVMENLKYPAESKVEGTVLTKFVIDKDGSLIKPTVVESLDPATDAEALRVLKAMPKWSPGMQDGNPVKVEMTLPLRFVSGKK